MGFLDDVIKGVADTVVPMFTDDTVSLRREDKLYDKVTGVESSLGRRDWVFKGSPRIYYREDQIDGETIKRGDFQLIVAAGSLTTVPLVSDTLIARDPLTREKVVHQIVNVERISAGDVDAAFILQLRK